MRRYSAIALIVCGSLALAGCGDADTTQPPPAPIAPHTAPSKDPQSPPPSERDSERDKEWDKDFHPRPRHSQPRE